MNIQYIFTFDELEQVMIDSEISEESLATMDGLISNAMSALKPKEKRNLIKISCCTYGENPPPDWYMKEKGKVWQEDIDKWRDANKIKSSATHKYY
jgi:hypothetical protein